jgi:hypothetical protein
MERHVGVLREPVYEKLHKRIDVLASDWAGVNGTIAVAVPDVDRLVQEDDIRVCVPTVRVLRRVLALVDNAAGAKFEE